MVSDSVPSSNALVRWWRGENGGCLKGLRFVDHRVERGAVSRKSIGNKVKGTTIVQQEG